MKDNFNDVTPDEIQDKEDKLNEILNSVDSKLKPNTNISGWEDELNSVLEKRSRATDIEEILKGISAMPESHTPAPKNTEVEKLLAPNNDALELVEQITIGKKVTELSQQKKMLAEELKSIPEQQNIINETFSEVSADTNEIPKIYNKPMAVENPEDTKSNTMVYNLPNGKVSASVVREAVKRTPATDIRKPVKKIVRVDKPKDHEPIRQPENIKKSVPEHKPVKKQPKKKTPEMKKKKSLKEKFLDLFPQKQDPILEKIRKVVFMCSIIAIVVCGYMVGDYYIDLGKSKSLHEEIASIYEPYHPATPAQNVATIYEPDYEREYTLLDGAKKLLDMNPDVVGYITIPDTPIANPVMQSGDNEKYLDININGDHSRAGELFLDYRNNFDRVVDNKLSVANSDNLVIYGHNMGNDTMFGCLKYYQRNYSYYSEHPIIYLNSNYECYTYKIFSYFILDALDESETAYDCWNKFDFDGEEDFYNFVNEAKKRSLGLNDVDVKYGDKLLTLSTCNTILGDRGRLIVMGRLLRDGEDVNQGTEKNVQNANIKWPSIYYQMKPNEKYNPDSEFVPYG
ncbi:MAG: class B sortase [Ruminococcus sp.]|nr:class B sortase [Ruminococcus sp.]MDE6539652.1 class B sortase [Ruminococcus sp.]